MKKVYLLAVMVFLVACGSQNTDLDNQWTAITNINLVPMTGEIILEN